MMKRHVLLSGIAAAAFAMVPTAGNAEVNGGTEVTSTFNESVDIEIIYDNYIDTTIDTHVDFDKEVSLRGEVELDGKIEVEAAAIAVSDVKQILEDNFVGDVSHDDDGNTVADFAVSGANGNVGVNVATGWFNMQANVATIASAAGDDGPGNSGSLTASSGGDGGDGGDGGNNRRGDGGWAEASTTSLQKLLNNYFCGSGCGTPNTVTISAVNGNGNIGVNAAAGAFNVQENILTLASVSDSSLAEASAGVIQASVNNTAYAGFTDNTVDLGTIGGSGNIGVNAAAGVGNVQHNSLTVAASLIN